MMTIRELMTSGNHSSPDGKHWEPALPTVGYRRLRDRLRDAWEVFQGRAAAIRQTRKTDTEPETPA